MCADVRVKWTLEAIDERRYYLKINNAPTAAIDNKVYALQVWQPTPEHEIWVIQNRPQFGANVFTYASSYLSRLSHVVLTIVSSISSTNGVTQWAVEHDAPYTQVSSLPVAMCMRVADLASSPLPQVVMRHAGLMPENPTADALFVFTRVH